MELTMKRAAKHTVAVRNLPNGILIYPTFDLDIDTPWAVSASAKTHPASRILKQAGSDVKQRNNVY
jgi:hypothetical protein